jgi:GNAT superfamily N-acetyltransferase
VTISITELPVPASVTDEDAAPFVAAITLINDVEARELGTTDLSYPPAESLPWWQREWEPASMFGVYDGERLVAASEITLSNDSVETAWVNVSVDPEYRRRGIGRSLTEHAVEFARSAGRTTVQASSIEPPSEGGERVQSPVGAGSIAASAPGPAFLLAHGFTLGQVVRVSRLPLPVGNVGNLGAAAEAASTDYDIVRWVGRTPDEFLDAAAALSNAIQADAPHGELDPGPVAWDATKVSANDELKAASPRTDLTVMAVHRVTGDVAGYSALSVPREIERPVTQEDTVVLSAHRGHRLGMLLKLANIRHLEETFPGYPSIVTYNAEENRHMLSVNEAVGFVPIGYEGGWKLSL